MRVASFFCWAVILGLSSSVAALDVPISARSLSITDNSWSGRKSKVTFAARDLSGAIDKGQGDDPGAISARFEMRWYRVEGSFAIPAGALSAGGTAGWAGNDQRGAKYVNRGADSGVPTGVKTLVIADGRSLKLSARTSGDEALALVSAGPPTIGIQTMLTIENDGEVIRHCTLFPAGTVKWRVSNRGTRVTAKHGVPYACPDAPMSLAPAPALPPAPTAPSLWFDGNDPTAVAAVIARTSHAETAALFNSIRATVNGGLASLGSASDDSRATIAKGAGLLHVTGAVPPGGSGFTSYRDVVVAALAGIEERNAADTLDEFLNPPANALDVLRDAGRLQSMAEAYDLIRGSGIDPLDDELIRARIANWADEYLLDWNLVGDSFGLFSGHRDNWAIKGGSAVVTAALALADHPNAEGWLAQGTQWVGESLATVTRVPGWYGESAHYLNYSLNNLVSTAWHLRHAAGADWFDDLERFIDSAFELRQPDGRQPPFEEGVSNTFPWDVLAAAYPDRAATMHWALAESPGDFSAYDNQQFHAVTRFFVRALDVVPAPPSWAPTTFVDGETHAVVLRSDWSAGAFQMTGLTAIDRSAEETFASRHHMENPLDVVLHGAGALLLPTASGGPTVTTSPNRAYYLRPSSKNIPLVDDNAPYVLEPLAVTLADSIDSRDADGLTHRLFDAATTTVRSFAAGVDVARTLAMVGDSYGIVVDRFVGPASHEYGITWRGRGEATLRSATASHVAADYDWPNSASPTAHLTVDTTASTGLVGELVPGFYAPTFGTEETLQPLSIASTAADATMLSVLRPRLQGAAAAVFTPLVLTGGAAATVTSGAGADVLIAGPEGILRTVGGFAADGRLALQRTTGGEVSGMAGVRVTRLASGSAVIASDAAIAVAATFTPGAAVVTIGSAVPVAIDLTELPGLNPAGAHTVTWEGVPLATENVTDQGGTIQVRLSGSGTLVLSDS
ncbi:MAG TPA: hypothetical protein VEB21_11545 [Terriglobales bacterium]|nr:hypothetical protein [Terriglobales bacterium]